MTFLFPSPAHVFSSAPLWIFSAIAIAAAVLSVGLDHRPTWMRYTRASALALFGASFLFVFIVIDCWGLPDWLCYLVP